MTDENDDTDPMERFQERVERAPADAPNASIVLLGHTPEGAPSKAHWQLLALTVFLADHTGIDVRLNVSTCDEAAFDRYRKLLNDAWPAPDFPTRKSDADAEAASVANAARVMADATGKPVEAFIPDPEEYPHIPPEDADSEMVRDVDDNPELYEALADGDSGREATCQRCGGGYLIAALTDHQSAVLGSTLGGELGLCPSCVESFEEWYQQAHD